MNVAALVIANLHETRMRNDPEYRADFLADAKKRLTEFHSRLQDQYEQKYGQRLDHPVVANAIRALEGGDLDHATYLLRNDTDKFAPNEREWLRDNGFIPRLPGR